MKRLLLGACLSLTLSALAQAEPLASTADFRPLVAEALARGEKKVVIPPGVYTLAPPAGGKVVWTLGGLRKVEIIADGVTLRSSKLTRALALHDCEEVVLRGLTVDYDPLPFTQGRVTAVAEDQSWIDVKLHEGYTRQPYSRIDVVDPQTRYRKKGMPFLWKTKATMQGADVVRITCEGIGKAAAVGDLASLNTGPASDGIPHAVSLEKCSSITLRAVTVHSAPGMGVLESDGVGRTQYLECRVVPGSRPAGALEERLLSTSWDAMQTKTVRVGPRIENCEIREAGDDSWSVQSADFMVLKAEGTNMILGSRDEYTIGVDVSDRLTTGLGAAEATIVSRRGQSREEAQLEPEILKKLQDAPGWSEWKVARRCIAVTLNQELPVKVGDSVYSPDRMGNGFEFVNNRVHSSGRILIKAAGRIEGNLLDTPHALVVCPELPARSAAGIEGLIIRRNKIRRAGWFCPAPWSSQAGALSITAAAGASTLRSAGVFQKVLVEENIFEECSGLNVAISSARDVILRGNKFIRPFTDKPSQNGASFQIPPDTAIWLSQVDGAALSDNAMAAPGAFGSGLLKLGPQVERLSGDVAKSR